MIWLYFHRSFHIYNIPSGYDEHSHGKSLINGRVWKKNHLFLWANGPSIFHGYVGHSQGWVSNSKDLPISGGRTPLPASDQPLGGLFTRWTSARTAGCKMLPKKLPCLFQLNVILTVIWLWFDCDFTVISLFWIDFELMNQLWLCKFAPLHRPELILSRPVDATWTHGSVRFQLMRFWNQTFKVFGIKLWRKFLLTGWYYTCFLGQYFRRCWSQARLTRQKKCGALCKLWQ